MINTDESLEILQFLDFEPTVPCVFPDCTSKAEWSIHWSCGCTFDFCTDHKNLMLGLVNEDGVACHEVHGLPVIYPLSVVPLDK